MNSGDLLEINCDNRTADYVTVWTDAPGFANSIGALKDGDIVMFIGDIATSGHYGKRMLTKFGIGRIGDSRLRVIT